MAELVRALDSAGIERFRKYLSGLRGNKRGDPPRGLLEDPRHTSELSVDVSIERRDFPHRLALGEYLCEILAPLPAEDTDRNQGLWTWLSLFLFDQVCPADPDGARRPGQDYRHIPEFSFRYRHRHLLFGPYQVFRRHGIDSTLLLSGPLHRESTIYHEIAGRQDLIANLGVVNAATRLYLDEDSRSPKPGSQAASVRGGSVRRFVRVLQQLDVNYDIYGMSGADILSLLPSEFDQWTNNG